MCGIIAIVSRPATRRPPEPGEVLALLDQAIGAGSLRAATAAVAAVNALLKGVPGVLALTGHPQLELAITARLDQLDAIAAAREAELEQGLLTVDAAEQANAALIDVRDAIWAVRCD